MGLDQIVTDGISLAKDLTGDLQPNVTIEPWTGSNNEGEATYGTGVTFAAVVEKKQRLVRDFNGVERVATAVVTILQAITADGTANRREPVDPQDRVTLADGEIGKILRVEGMISKATGAPYMVQIWLG